MRSKHNTIINTISNTVGKEDLIKQYITIQIHVAFEDDDELLLYEQKKLLFNYIVCFNCTNI